MIVSGTHVTGRKLALVLKVDGDGLISHEVVDFHTPAKKTFSDGDLLYAQTDAHLSVFKVVTNSNDTTYFEQIAVIKLASDEELYGFEKGTAKVRSSRGTRSISIS